MRTQSAQWKPDPAVHVLSRPPGNGLPPYHPSLTRGPRRDSASHFPIFGGSQGACTQKGLSHVRRRQEVNDQATKRSGGWTRPRDAAETSQG